MSTSGEVQLECDSCGEPRQPSDPELFRNPNTGKLVCCFCGYWNLPPGEGREELRRERSLNMAAGVVRGSMRLGCATVALDFSPGNHGEVLCVISFRALEYGSGVVVEERRHKHERFVAPTMREAFAHAAVWIEARLSEGGVP